MFFFRIYWQNFESMEISEDVLHNYIKYGAFFQNIEKACKILKNEKVYTEKLENSLEALDHSKVSGLQD